MTKNKALEEIKEQLDKGIQAVMTSEKFQEWLQFLSSFHSYSFNNTILIYMQNPHATFVKGFKEWKKHSRFVKKGAKSIKVLAPLIGKKKEKEEESDKEEKEKKVLYGFRYVNVFIVDGKPIDVGYFVTLDGNKVRRANETDDYILGITSATPAVLADSGELRWKNKYVTDEWGRVQYHDILIPVKKDKEGNVILPERTERQPILNPDWDPNKEYIPRIERPEWVAVGLLGKLLIRDDGTCQVNGYCKPSAEGIATASNKGYRVMERTGPNQILVLFR